jgi:hypothetical protein
MKEDLLACLRVFPKHQYALSLLSLFEKTMPNEFLPFPARDLNRRDLELQVEKKNTKLPDPTATYFTAKHLVANLI